MMTEALYPESPADVVYLARVEDAYPSYADAFKTYDSPSFVQTENNPDHVEQFEDDINNLASTDPLFDTVATDVFSGELSLLRSETPTRGPFSIFTVSSESAYDSLYNDSASAYAYNTPSQYSASYLTSPSSQCMVNPALAEIDFAMQGLGLRPEGGSAYGGAVSSSSLEPSAALNTFPPSAFSRSALSDYEPPSVQVQVPASSASDYYPGRVSPVRQSTVSPANVAAPLPGAAPGPTPVPSPQTNTTPLKLEGGNDSEPERRFPCPSCPRSFTRRYNLKTHIATHDVNRLKPFVCDRKSCGRSFSRKNDLKRHMRSIHRPDTPTSSVHSVGVGGNPRTRCDKCGKSWVGKDKETSCDCDDVK